MGLAIYKLLGDIKSDVNYYARKQRGFKLLGMYFSTEESRKYAKELWDTKCKTLAGALEFSKEINKK